MQLPQALEGLLLDPVDVVLVEAQLNDVGRQVGRDLRQQVVGQVKQPQVVHVSEGLGVDLGDLVVDQEQTLKVGEDEMKSNSAGVELFFCIAAV